MAVFQDTCDSVYAPVLLSFEQPQICSPGRLSSRRFRILSETNEIQPLCRSQTTRKVRITAAIGNLNRASRAHLNRADNTTENSNTIKNMNETYLSKVVFQNGDNCGIDGRVGGMAVLNRLYVLQYSRQFLIESNTSQITPERRDIVPILIFTTPD
jgi:hypothetical protein